MWLQSQHTGMIRTVLMHSMAEWYTTDQAHLSRILDVAQDLKALSLLLKATPFSFVIDLACLASRREYLKLEKWLHDKIMENQVTLPYFNIQDFPRPIKFRGLFFCCCFFCRSGAIPERSRLLPQAALSLTCCVAEQG